MSLQGHLAIAQRKGQKHFTFCYNVADMADASDVRTAMHGNDLAKNAWLCNGYFWWSAVITVFSPNADGTVTEVKAYCRDTMRRRPHDLTKDLHKAIERLHKEHPDADMSISTVSVTCSVVCPKWNS